MSSLKWSASLARSFSTLPNARKIVVCSNGAVATWHPKPNFPYEHSRPIILKKNENAQEGVLSSAVKRVSKIPSGPNNSQLKEIFYTDKNEWYTRTREDRLRSVAAPIPKRK